MSESIHLWAATAMAQKVGVAETAADFFKRRAQGHTGGGLARILDKVPDRPAEPGDEVPPGYVPRTSKSPSER